MGNDMQQRLAAAQAGAAAHEQKQTVIGQELDDVSRYAETTQRMIVFDVLENTCPIGGPGDRVRVFLSDEGYTDMLVAQSCGVIKILRHARVKSGKLYYDASEKAF